VIEICPPGSPSADAPAGSQPLWETWCMYMWLSRQLGCIIFLLQCNWDFISIWLWWETQQKTASCPPSEVRSSPTASSASYGILCNVAICPILFHLTVNLDHLWRGSAVKGNLLPIVGGKKNHWCCYNYVMVCQLFGWSATGPVLFRQTAKLDPLWRSLERDRLLPTWGRISFMILFIHLWYYTIISSS